MLEWVCQKVASTGGSAEAMSTGAVLSSLVAGYYSPAIQGLSSPVGAFRRGYFAASTEPGTPKGVSTRRYCISGSLGVKQAKRLSVRLNTTQKGGVIRLNREK